LDSDREAALFRTPRPWIVLESGSHPPRTGPTRMGGLFLKPCDARTDGTVLFLIGGPDNRGARRSVIARSAAAESSTPAILIIEAAALLRPCGYVSGPDLGGPIKWPRPANARLRDVRDAAHELFAIHPRPETESGQAA